MNEPLEYAIVKISARRFVVMRRFSQGLHSIPAGGEWKNPQKMHAIETWAAVSKPLNWSGARMEYARLYPESIREGTQT